MWSFVHVADAAEATVAAIEADRPGLYNVVDDEPARVADWLPEVARAIGAKPPRHVPRLVGRLLAGEAATVMMTEVRGASNAKAKASSAGCRGTRRGAGTSARTAAAAAERRGASRGGRVSTPSAHEDVLADVRSGAFALAYRMLGSVAEAEDVVQEALLRLHDALEAGEDIRSPRAYAATVTTRLAIDQLRSARRTREQYVGDWLPEPLLTEGGADDPAHAAELADSLSVAFLVLLEQLSPRQRAALLLHDVFDYGYDEVAAIIGSTEAAARQLASRARRQVEEGRPRFDASREQRDELARRFFAAALDGDMQALEALLAEDVVLQGDGGGKVPALARALHGRTRVARTVAAWGRHGARLGLSLHPAEVNGQPGAVLRDAAGEVIGAMTVDVAGDAVVGVRSVVNPEKLGHLQGR